MRILGACDKTPRKQDKSLVTSVSWKHRIVLGTMCLVDKSEFTSAIVSHMTLWKSIFCHMWLVLMIVHFTQVTLLNSQSTSCLML